MIKIKYMQYNPCEYMNLQYDLEQLASQGYYPKKLNRFTIFRKVEQSNKYFVEVFCQSTKNRRDKRIAKIAHLEHRKKKGYHTLGQLGDIMIFTTNEQMKTKWTESLYRYFHESRIFSTILSIMFSLAFLCLVLYAFIETHFMDLFSSNGRFIYMFVPIIGGLLCFTRNIMMFKKTNQLAKLLDTYKLPEPSKSQSHKYMTSAILLTVLLTAFGLLGEVLTSNKNIHEYELYNFVDEGITQDHFDQSSQSSLLFDTYQSIQYSDDFSFEANNEVSGEIFTYTNYNFKMDFAFTYYYENVINDAVKKINSNIYGIIENDKLTSIYLIKNNKVEIFSATFDLNPYIDLLTN